MKVVNLRAARKAAEKRKYSALVLDAFDNLTAGERRERRERKAKEQQVRAKAKKSL